MFKKLIGWALDYLYVVRWSIQNVLLRQDTAQYLHPRTTAKNPIILIPGVYENWKLLRPLAQCLYDEGHPIHVLDGLGYNTGQIPKMALITKEYLKAHDLHDAIILAHSKGGLIAKYVLSGYDLENRITHVVALNTPFSGSRYAYLFLLPSVRSFAPTHKTIRLLASNQVANGRITSIYSSFDPHIPETSYLPGAENIELPLMGHFRPIGNRLTQEIIMEVVKRKAKG